MKNQISVLKQLGLNEREAKFYLAALELGPTTILKLSKKTSLQRSSIYEFLDSLIDKGVIEVVISGKRKLYKGTAPEELKSLLKKQEELLESITPELTLLMNKGVQKPKIMYFEGLEGIKKVYEDTLNQPEGSEFVAFTSLEDIFSVVPDSYAQSYLKRRAKKKIFVRVIVKEDDFSKDYIGKNDEEYRETLAVKEKLFPLSNEINIYQNKVAILSFGEEKIGVIIESKQIADSIRAIFNALWISLKNSK